MKNAFVLPENECERLTRMEMMACRMVLALVSEVNYASSDLAKRLEIVPEGKERMNRIVTESNDLLQDILGTVTVRQTKQLLNDAKDLEIRLVPKLASERAVISFRRDVFENLIYCAREKCKFCSEDANTCNACKLYQLLETTVPLDDYDDGITCPYAYREWGD